MSTAPVSVVIPTAGRVALLRRCLESVCSCDPRADEVLVVDQSGSADLARVVAEFAGCQLIVLAERGIGVATNAGLARANHDTVLVTHDDCTVAKDWVATARDLICQYRSSLLTGRVLPVGDPRSVPSVIDEPTPHDYTGEVECGALYPNNMVGERRAMLAIGGFDNRLPTAAEDNDFCYRWLRAGYRLRYEPALVVHHHDWRTPDDLRKLYDRYWQEQGAFYAKHLLRRDFTMLRFIARDFYSAARRIAGLCAGKCTWSPWPDPRRGIVSGLARGLIVGWFRFSARGHRSTARLAERRS